MSMSSYTTIYANWPQETRTYKPIRDVFDRVNVVDGRVFAEWDDETSYSDHVLDDVIAMFGRRLDTVDGLDLHCHYETNCVDEGFFGFDLTIEDGVCHYEQSVIRYEEMGMGSCPVAISNPKLEHNEDKEGFVNAINEALIKHGNGRYDYLMDNPVHLDDGVVAGTTVMRRGSCGVDVTCDSLTSIMREFSRLV